MWFLSKQRRQGLGLTTFGNDRRPVRRSPRGRRRLLGVDALEERLAPAAGILSLGVVGTAPALIHSATGTNPHVITLAVNGNQIQLTDSAGTITSQVSGVTAAGLASATGATIPGQIQDIVISGQSSLTTLTLGELSGKAFSTSRSLVLNATTITTTTAVDADSITATGQVIYLGGNLSSAGLGAGLGTGPVAGNITLNGQVDLTAAAEINTASTVNGNLTFNGEVLGAKALTINAGTTGAVTATQPIALTGTGGLTIGSVAVSIGGAITGTPGGAASASIVCR